MTNKVPNIRFKGFTDDWEQRKLGDVFDERSERASGNEELLSVTISNGVIRQIDSEKRNIASEDKSNYKVVKKGDVPYNSMRMWQGAVGTSDYDGIVSPAYTVLIPKNNCNGKFFMELFKKQPTLENFKRWSQGLTSDTWNLKYPVLSTIPFMVPSVKEQEKIAEYFKSLDNLITLHQRKCEQTKELKKFMLQKMFPKKGEKNPEIRFPGFTDDWEQRKVDEVTTSYSGGTPQAGNSEYYNGTIPFIRSGEIYKNHTELFITQKGLENSSAKMVSKGDILYALYGATSGEVSRSNINGAINQAILAITPNKGYNADFIVEWFRNEKENIIDKYLQGGQGNLSAQIIKNLEIPFPTFEEQEKVGGIFIELNHLITLHQRKCEQLKELKKFMLQNMFPKKG